MQCHLHIKHATACLDTAVVWSILGTLPLNDYKGERLFHWDWRILVHTHSALVIKASLSPASDYYQQCINIIPLSTLCIAAMNHDESLQCSTTWKDDQKEIQFSSPNGLCIQNRDIPRSTSKNVIVRSSMCIIISTMHLNQFTMNKSPRFDKSV